MWNFSIPEKSGNYTLEVEEYSGSFSFLTTLVSLLVNKDVFPDSFLSKDVFPDIHTFLAKFQDSLSDHLYSLLASIPALGLALCGLALASVVAMVLLALARSGKRIPEQSVCGKKRSDTGKRIPEQSVPGKMMLVVVLVCCLAGCLWTVQKARLVDRGARQIPEVSRVHRVRKLILTNITEVEQHTSGLGGLPQPDSGGDGALGSHQPG